MINQGDWSEEVSKRLRKNFNYKVFADIILPIKCGAHWVMLTCNFEKREIHIVYFKCETALLRLALLNDLGITIWQAGS